MAVKFYIGERVYVYDFEEERIIEGVIVAAFLWSDNAHESECKVHIKYDIDCDGVIYERKEKHIYSTKNECLKYLRNLCTVTI